MRTRIFTFILAALPFALTAQASEIPMDASGMHSGSSAAAYTSGSRGDCASTRSMDVDEHAAANGDNSNHHVSASTPGTRMRVSDESVEESGDEPVNGGSATGKSLAVPVKSRSTRWQSLIPGAIK